MNSLRRTYEEKRVVRTFKTFLEETIKSAYSMEDKYRKLFDDLPIGVYIIGLGRTDKRLLDGEIIDVNPEALSMLGYIKEDVIGRSIFDLVLEEQIDEFRNRLEARLLGESYPKKFDRRLLKSNGDKIIVTTKVKVYRDGQGLPTEIMLMVRDMTESRLTELDLYNNKTFLEDILKTSVDPIVLTDKKGYIIFVSDVVKSIMGYQAEELF